ncbi:hypothetical protein F2Q68_00013118 [Brassica cretica]|uniref:Uncharacterized protein n=1 Tax=Brassica cretica TaxID=69181 RepID=A0A8S9HIE7_BRACR|nr:hypothetical protein F2Q68_00013118 [Brassica cretica]
MKFIVYTIALLLVLLTQGRSDDEHWCIASPGTPDWLLQSGARGVLMRWIVAVVITFCFAMFRVAVRKARVDKKTNRDDHGQTQACLAANDK